ncbi:MAG: signal peptidase I [Acidimicrobiales bacterium]
MARLRTVGRWFLIVLAALLVAALLFVDVGPRFLPYQALVVRSGSMSPTLPTGSLVFYHKTEASQLKVGDIIVFNEPNDPTKKVTHRIYAIRSGTHGRYFITKGDANAVPDAWTVPAVGVGWEASWHVPDIGYVLVYLESSSLRFLLIVIPALVLVVLALLDFRRSRHLKSLERAPDGP